MAFSLTPQSASSTRALFGLPATTSLDNRSDLLNEPEQQVFSFVKELHDSSYKFRIVVVGNGAILETTSALGPVVKLSNSPSAGTNLLTLASEDQSLEFHLQLSQVTKIVLTTKETSPDRTLQIVRLLNATGVSMCSFILADESEAAKEWYQALQTKHGNEIQL
jgi:hypothetical protein